MAIPTTTNRFDRLEFERRLWGEGYHRIMGLDEVGRGCLSGPVVAAGVIFKVDTQPDSAPELLEIRDSKVLSEADRDRLAVWIRSNALFWTIQARSPAEIDKFNILKASIQAMMACSESKGADADYLLVDGNRFAPSLVPCECIVKGDDKSLSIASASILAKVHRDTLMRRLHQEFPHYGWDTNVGYPTQAHYAGLQKVGYTEHHRRSFKLRTDRKFIREAADAT